MALCFYNEMETFLICYGTLRFFQQTRGILNHFELSLHYQEHAIYLPEIHNFKCFNNDQCCGESLKQWFEKILVYLN